ncbi:hypothetical protein BJP34_29960 [Moorena producens PAL-8-15-08-1]|uniref:Uncharacterized protein n=1 Tax=Moorena producens PAL-8-15-08-1 TaxID=1458985 RepID=A0A1D8TZN8_9CYAN|nr:hypothetical protein BJP34_29960 [Moorena producens PAL-8-15-08-1]
MTAKVSDSCGGIINNYKLSHKQRSLLKLPDIYLLIGYYLRHRDQVHTYLAERQRQANVIQQEAEQRFNPIGIRDR